MQREALYRLKTKTAGDAFPQPYRAQQWFMGALIIRRTLAFFQMRLPLLGHPPPPVGQYASASGFACIPVVCGEARPTPICTVAHNAHRIDTHIFNCLHHRAEASPIPVFTIAQRRLGDKPVSTMARPPPAATPRPRPLPPERPGAHPALHDSTARRGTPLHSPPTVMSLPHGRRPTGTPRNHRTQREGCAARGRR